MKWPKAYQHDGHTQTIDVGLFASKPICRLFLSVRLMVSLIFGPSTATDSLQLDTKIVTVPIRSRICPLADYVFPLWPTVDQILSLCIVRLSIEQSSGSSCFPDMSTLLPLCDSSIRNNLVLSVHLSETLLVRLGSQITFNVSFRLDICRSWTQ